MCLAESQLGAAMGGRAEGLGALKAYVTDDLPELGKIYKFSTRNPVENNEKRKTNTIRDIHYTLHQFLTKLAGGEDEIARLLTDKNHGYITRYLKEAKKNIEADIREAMSPPESERALVQKLGEAFSNASTDRDRRTLLQFVCKRHPKVAICRRELVRLGWRGLGDKLIESTRRTVQAPNFRHKPLDELQVRKAGGAEISEETWQQINDAWYENSHVASEIQGGDLVELEENPLRFTSAPVWTIARQIEGAGICAANTAVKYKPPNIVKPVRKTDYCRYCFKWRRLLHQMRPYIAKLKTRYGLRDELPADHLRKFWHSMSLVEKARISDVDKTQINQYLDVFHEHETHRNNARRQKEQYTKEAKLHRLHFSIFILK